MTPIFTDVRTAISRWVTPFWSVSICAARSNLVLTLEALCFILDVLAFAQANVRAVGALITCRLAECPVIVESIDKQRSQGMQSGIM
jgi:hypothetical protein